MQRLVAALALTPEEHIALEAAARAPDGIGTAPSAPPQNLPVQPSSFIGREREREQVLALLKRAPLVTLAGAGGAGKTRLALAVAADLMDAYPDGIWLVDLAPLIDSRLVEGAVAATLGLREEANRPLSATLIDHLKGRQALLRRACPCIGS